MKDGSHISFTYSVAGTAAVSACDRYLAMVWREKAGENFDQCRFSSTVFAAERMNLAREEIEIDSLECMYAAECLGKATHRDDRFSRGGDRHAHTDCRKC
ncbi:MAG: hypothetical protein U0805_09415 [Pirellulales bacterium]